MCSLMWWFCRVFVVSCLSVSLTDRWGFLKRQNMSYFLAGEHACRPAPAITSDADGSWQCRVVSQSVSSECSLLPVMLRLQTAVSCEGRRGFRRVSSRGGDSDVGDVTGTLLQYNDTNNTSINQSLRLTNCKLCTAYMLTSASDRWSIHSVAPTKNLPLPLQAFNDVMLCLNNVNNVSNF